MHSPPALMGSKGWVHWLSDRDKLRIKPRPSLRIESYRSGYGWPAHGKQRRPNMRWSFEELSEHLMSIKTSWGMWLIYRLTFSFSPIFHSPLRPLLALFLYLIFLSKHFWIFWNFTCSKLLEFAPKFCSKLSGPVKRCFEITDFNFLRLALNIQILLFFRVAPLCP